MTGLATFALVCAFLNVACGRKLFGLTQSTMFSRVVMGLGIGIASQVCLGFSVWQGLVVAIGLIIWRIPGWGKYFSAIHGKDDPKETEIRWIDDIGYFVVHGNDEWSNRKRGLLCMCIRGVYLYPMFIGLSFFGNLFTLLIGLGCLLQGLPYFLSHYVQRITNPVAVAEALWGVVIAIMLGVL